MFKHQHALESKLHEQLYGNIHLLTLTYPPINEFKFVFKQDMFRKNNKAGFHQVVYYLLSTLNPSVIKEKIISWPIYEIKQESVFRNEVIKYINELNSIYEDANMPMVMTSHLITPGGVKFVKLLHKLSQLVLYQHLKRNTEFAEDIFCGFKPNKNREITLKNLNRLESMTNEIKEEIAAITEKHEGTLNDYKNKGNDLMQKQNDVTQKMSDYKKFLQENGIISLEEGSMNTNELIKLQEILNFKNKIINASELVNYLISTDICLEYKNSEFQIPKEILHILNANTKKIDLIKLLEGFIVFMEHQRFKINSFDLNYIETSLNKYSVLNEQLEALIGDSNEIKNCFIDYLIILKNIVCIEAEETLATPLLDSPTI